MAAALFGLLLAACGGSESKDAIELVPARATLIGAVDLPQILADADVTTAYGLIAASDTTMPATLSDALTDVETRLGITLASFGLAVVFADVDDTDAEYGGLIAAGELDRDEIFTALRGAEEAEFTDGEYRDEPLLVSGGEDVLVAAVVAGNLIMGSREAVQDVIDIENGEGTPVAGDLLAFYNELGDAWFKLVADVPSDAVDGLDTADLGLPFDVGGALDVVQVGVSGGKDAADAVLTIELRYPSEAQAMETAETLDALVTLAATFAGDGDLDSITDALTISAAGVAVTIELRSSIEEFLKDLEGFDGGFEPGVVGL